MSGMLAGCVTGAAASVILCFAAYAATRKIFETRRNIRALFIEIFAAAFILIVMAVHFYPYQKVRPGSDYDIAMKNFLIQGFGYSAGAGFAAIIAAAGVRLKNI